MFVAHDLGEKGERCDGVAYELNKSAPDYAELPWYIKLSDPKWIGLDVSLLDPRCNERSPPLLYEIYLGVPSLDAILVHEMAHVWDYRLEAAGSPYSSAGAEWRTVEFDPRGRIRPFTIPTRRLCHDPHEQSAEDWAEAVVWFVFRPGDLAPYDRARYDFVERLFRERHPS